MRKFPFLSLALVIIMGLLSVGRVFVQENVSAREQVQQTEEHRLLKPMVFKAPIDRKPVNEVHIMSAVHTDSVPDAGGKQAEAQKEAPKEAQEPKEPKRPPLPNLPLPDPLLDYLWDRSRESGLSFSLLLAIAKQESNLGQDKINVNTNGTVDKGIMQVNSSSLDWLAGLARIQEVDPMNDYHSVDLAIAFLKFARNYWEKQGLTGERLENYMIVSYNRGIGGCRYYDQTYGINNNAYLIKVRQNQERFDLQL